MAEMLIINKIPRMRFERMTYRLEGGCSIQLSYRGLILFVIQFYDNDSARSTCLSLTFQSQSVDLVSTSRTLFSRLDSSLAARQLSYRGLNFEFLIYFVII